MVENDVTDKPTIDSYWEEVQVEAFQIFAARLSTGQWGDDVSDWIQAEELVKVRHSL
jgi:hypothetical protein